jgi:hypothetical protein
LVEGARHILSGLVKNDGQVIGSYEAVMAEGLRGRARGLHVAVARKMWGLWSRLIVVELVLLLYEIKRRYEMK